jgi:predicted nucleotidyltransferase
LGQDSTVLLLKIRTLTVRDFFINDRDDIVPSKDRYFGLIKHSPLETVEFDNKLEGKDSVNGVLHSVRKFIQLSSVGNPTIIEVSFIPDQFVIETTHLARSITAFVQDNLITKKVIRCYNGYFIHEVRQASSKKNLKSAAHAYRIANQALQICTDGFLNPCLTGELHSMVTSIRAGKYTWEDLELIMAEMDFKLQEADKTNTLPTEPDEELINKFLIETHDAYYSGLGYPS